MTSIDDQRADQVQLVAIADAACLMCVPLATLRYWRYLGTGPRSFRVGRRVVYRRAEIARWLEDQESAEIEADDR